jgi:hypothetical protein
MTLPAGFYPAGKTGLFYAADGSGPYLQNADGSMSQGFPKKLFTDGDGENARLRVDVAQTGFFAGREFRTFLRLDMPPAQSILIRATVPINTILFKFSANIESGTLDIASLVGGTPSGLFDTLLPIFRTNTMSTIPQPPYVGQVILGSGGAVVGATEISALRAKAAGNSQQASSVGASEQDERGLAAGTYYIDLRNVHATDNVVGIFEARWEERP